MDTLPMKIMIPAAFQQDTVFIKLKSQRSTPSDVRLERRATLNREKFNTTTSFTSGYHLRQGRKKVIDVSHRLFQSEEGLFRLEKGILGAIVGVLLGIATYIAFEHALHFSPLISGVIGALTGVTLAVGLALNSHVRAVVSLCMPTFCLNSGRLILTTLIAALLLTGPIVNISMNAAELAESSACTGELLYNQTLAIQRLAREPYLKFLSSMEKSIDDLRKDLSTLKDIWNRFKDAADVFISPFTNKELINEIDEILTVGFTFDYPIEVRADSIPSRDELLEGIEEDIEETMQVVDMVLNHMNRILTLTALLLIVRSALYIREYTKKDVKSKDNRYITELFVNVDKKRKAEGKSSLLPLAPAEKKLVTDKRQRSMSSVEWSALRRGLMPTFISILGGAVTIGGDYLLYQVVQFIRRHSNISIHVDMDAIITVHKVNKPEFRVDGSQKMNISTAECLPKGSQPDHAMNIGIGVFYLFLLLTVVFQAYLTRLRHKMAGYFYPEAEKRRVKALHRKLLQQRVITQLRAKDDLRAMKLKKFKKRNITQPKNILQKLMSKVTCLKCFQTKPKCFICKSASKKTNSLNECGSCEEYFCQDCTKIVVKKSGCLCMDDKQALYDEIAESDFEDLDVAS